MSYLGLVKPIINSYFKDQNIEQPRILEIGVDRGQTTYPLIQNLAQLFKTFIYVGIDINIQNEVVESLTQFDSVSVAGWDEYSGRDAILIEANSLKWLPLEKSRGPFYHLALVDGDHNYFTLRQELEGLLPLLFADSIIVCDDYNGRWAEKDLFYSEKPEYANVEIATKRQNTEKQGVKAAVADFIKDHPEWEGYHHESLDPIILYNRVIWEPLETAHKSDEFINCRDMRWNFKRRVYNET
jgi:hypothetical protein|tara:strand:- start:2399 stop:3121 length:723 start_codon:yes stop_codon:yes gene_type:complete